MRIFSIVFIAKLAATLFIAVCIALGIGPDKWAQTLIGLDQPDLLWVARLAFFGLALFIIWIAFLAPALASSVIVCPWMFRPEDDDLMPIRRMITLSEAARLANEKFRGRTPEQQKISAMAADREWGDGRRDPLGWFGTAIKRKGEFVAFGYRLPSTKLEIIPQSLWKHGALSDDANSIQFSQDHEPQYIDITIKKSDFKKKLKEIESWDQEKWALEQKNVVPVVNSIKQDVFLVDAFYYVASGGDWDMPKRSDCPGKWPPKGVNSSQAFDSIGLKMRHNAHNGKLPIWGEVRPSPEPELIPPSFFKKSGFGDERDMALFGINKIKFETKPDRGNKDEKIYWALKTNRASVEKLYGPR